MPNFNEPRKIPHGLLLAALAALTLLLVGGIWFFMKEDGPAAAAPAAGQEIFKGSEQPRALNPAARSETGSSGGLDMFSKTNAGYYGEEESTGTAEAPQAGPAAPKAAPPAKKTAVPKAKARSTVIPRMKPSGFGGVKPTGVTPGGAGQGMPDISNLMKQAQQGGGGD